MLRENKLMIKEHNQLGKYQQLFKIKLKKHAQKQTSLTKIIFNLVEKYST